MEFTPDQWQGLRQHAVDRGLLFLSSPFSIEAVELLMRVGVDAWKVASGEITNRLMLEALLQTDLPMILSSGMSDLEELDRAVSLVQSHGNRLAVLQCTTAYPCPPEKIGLNLLAEFRDRYQCPVGLSDHSGTIFPGLAAVTLGAKVIEVHVTFSRQMFGPDVPASLTTAELSQLVQGTRVIERMLASPLNKNELAGTMQDLRGMFTKSIVARNSLVAGTVLTAEHLAIKKPGDGLPVDRYDSVIGRRLSQSLEADAPLLEEHLEPN
jgi:N-acetylneuraminate synthase